MANKVPTAAIQTPHAAIKIWNYVDRITDSGANPAFTNKVKEEIISTVSCQSIQTNKSKGEPNGSFNFVLAPTRNWVSVITPGSWCVILMSNRPIAAEDFKHANINSVKMFGRIDTVRVEVTVAPDGARQTRYLVAGQDWSSIFNNIFYIDPLIANPSDPNGQMSSALYQQIITYILSRNNNPFAFDIAGNLQALLSIFGSPLNLPDTTRIGKATHNISIPSEAASFFNFVDANGAPSGNPSITDLIKLQTGAIQDGGEYNTQVKDGQGFPDPFSMVGSHTLWSVLMENSNYALNEMYSDLRWKNVGGKKQPQLALYNRIKPFAFKDSAPVQPIDDTLRPKFQNCDVHKLNTLLVTSVNAGTNWRDKFNFTELKLDVTGYKIFDLAVKSNSQGYQNQGGAADTNIFDREGFRPIIFNIKQVPLQTNDDGSPNEDFLASQLKKWVNQIQEWYFDTHRLLNGQVTMTGSTEYISVGNNIMFDAELVGVTHNYNSAAPHKKNCFVLGHVEAVQHNFSVTPDGARTFQTTINFVRGILVDSSGKSLVGEGTIDSLSTSLSYNASKNNNAVQTALPDKKVTQ